MGSDPQSYLQMMHENDMCGFLEKLHEKFPIAVYSGSHKLDLGSKKISALCGSPMQAKAIINTLWPTTGYMELWKPDDLIWLL